MSQRVYRVCRAIHVRLDGEGARRVGGRWNSRGRALSALIPDELSVLTEEEVNEALPNAGPRELGDHWLESLASVVLRVRSAVIPEDFNFLLNSAHPGFARIVAERSKPFIFDERLFHSR